MVVFRLISVIIFITSTASLSQLEFPYQSKISHSTHAAAFDRLLNSIVKINQQRLDAAKKLNRLQELKPYAELRSDTDPDSDESSSEEREREVVYLVIPDNREINDSQDGLRLAAPESLITPPPETNHTNTTKHDQPKPDIVIQPIRNHNISDAYITPRGKNETMAHMSLSTDGLEYLRQSIARSCKNRDVKRCKNACKEAIHSACSYYDCRRKLKKSLKRNCKKACKEEFRGGW